jgi:hypothetical protein
MEPSAEGVPTRLRAEHMYPRQGGEYIRRFLPYGAYVERYVFLSFETLRKLEFAGYDPAKSSGAKIHAGSRNTKSRGTRMGTMSSIAVTRSRRKPKKDAIELRYTYATFNSRHTIYGGVSCWSRNLGQEDYHYLSRHCKHNRASPLLFWNGILDSRVVC